MSVSQVQRDAAHRIAHEVPNVDDTLPIWARRRNPIILRLLGEHWRVFLPQIPPLIKSFLFQVVIVLLTIQFDWMYIVILTFLIPMVVAVPYAGYIYIQALGRAISLSTTGMAEEYEHNTLRLLRTTPFSSKEITLSKIMAAVWRQADDLDYLMLIATTISMPIILAIYLGTFPPEDIGYAAQIMTIVTFAASVIRIPLELFMVASLGTMMANYVRSRSIAFLLTASLVFFYFLLINLARLVPMDWPLQLLVDAALPLILPPIVSMGAIAFAVWQIEQD